jgi:hypothetical protein
VGGAGGRGATGGGLDAPGGTGADSVGGVVSGPGQFTALNCTFTRNNAEQ